MQLLWVCNSNPTAVDRSCATRFNLRRQQYDQQLDALERQAKGILINTSAIKPWRPQLVATIPD
eukprot:2741123-Karenia_brevis.AAC.1